MVIKSISISDVHLGCNKLHPTFIPNNLRTTLYPYLNDDLDILFIVGDFFDTLLDMDGLAGYNAICVINEILALAVTHNFLVRVLQGTFSHDRRQNQIFKSDKKISVNSHDEEIVKVFDSIDIEYIDSLEISVMYVPDDLPYKNGMEIIRDKLDTSNLTQADFILNHGYFKHLIPIGMPHTPPNTLDAEVMSKLVKATVLNGHIHTPTVFKKVINNGSFDRLKHNEDHPKGFFIIDYDTISHTTSHEFIENKHAAIFKTVNLTRFGDRVEDAINFSTKIITPIFASRDKEEPIFIRVISDDITVRQAVVMYIGQKYHNAKLLSKPNKKHTEDEDSLTTLRTTDDLIEITESNVVEMIVQFSHDNGDDLDVAYVKQKLGYE